MRIEAQIGTHFPRIVVAESGVLKVKGAELYTNSLTIGETVTLDDIAAVVEEVPGSEFPRYDGDLLDQIETVNAIAEAVTTTPVDTDEKAWSADEGWLAVGTVRTYGGRRYEVIQFHKTSSAWVPGPATAALYRDVGAVGSEGEIPEWVQPGGAHDAYDIGDKVRFNGKVYESQINANVYSPAEYPAGWAEV